MTSDVSYSLNDGTLSVWVGDAISWQGMPDGRRVEDVRIIEGDDAVLLLEYPLRHGRTRNLVRIDMSGTIVWRAELPSGSGTDFFVSLDLDGEGNAIASTWTCYRALIRLRDGSLVSSTFTK